MSRIKELKNRIARILSICRIVLAATPTRAFDPSFRYASLLAHSTRVNIIPGSISCWSRGDQAIENTWVHPGHDEIVANKPT